MIVDGRNRTFSNAHVSIEYGVLSTKIKDSA